MDYQYIEKMDEKAQRNVASLFQALHKSDLPPSLVTQVKDSAEDLSYLFKSTTDPDAFVSRLARVTPSDQLVGDLAADHAYKYMNSSPEERLKRFQEILKKLQDKAARSATRLKDETKDLIRTIAEIRALNELIDNQQQVSKYLLPLPLRPITRVPFPSSLPDFACTPFFACCPTSASFTTQSFLSVPLSDCRRCQAGKGQDARGQGQP